MLFNSIHFLVFLPIVSIVYFALPKNHQRRILLLMASYYFYWVFSVPLSLLLVYSTLLDYTTARIIDSSKSPTKRKVALWVSITGNLLMLGIFKYYHFFNATLGTPWPTLDIILPIGISFYTFQTMSYTIDVYRGDVKASKSLLDVAVYVAFFPQLVAGPIERGSTLLPQLREKHEVDSKRILAGILLCVWGLSKKVFIADPMGIIVDSVYGTAAYPVAASGFSGTALLIATYAFAIQIYCDFSAYSDIAIGAASILGYRLMQNFNAPYLAITMRDFWRRWHISLSTWLRDYLYIPLGGSKKGPKRTYVNLLITMILGGLWHGANWTFIVWGILHGGILSLERLFKIDQLKQKDLSVIKRWVLRFITFQLVCLTWIFFRATDINHAFEILIRILSLADGKALQITPVLLILGLVLFQSVKHRFPVKEWFLNHPHSARWLIYCSLFIFLIVLSSARTPEFIYFQF